MSAARCPPSGRSRPAPSRKSREPRRPANARTPAPSVLRFPLTSFKLGFVCILAGRTFCRQWIQYDISQRIEDRIEGGCPVILTCAWRLSWSFAVLRRIALKDPPERRSSVHPQLLLLRILCPDAEPLRPAVQAKITPRILHEGRRGRSWQVVSDPAQGNGVTLQRQLLATDFSAVILTSTPARRPELRPGASRVQIHLRSWTPCPLPAWRKATGRRKSQLNISSLPTAHITVMNKRQVSTAKAARESYPSAVTLGSPFRPCQTDFKGGFRESRFPGPLGQTGRFVVRRRMIAWQVDSAAFKDLDDVRSNSSSSRSRRDGESDADLSRHQLRPPAGRTHLVPRTTKPHLAAPDPAGRECATARLTPRRCRRVRPHSFRPTLPHTARSPLRSGTHRTPPRPPQRQLTGTQSLVETASRDSTDLAICTRAHPRRHVVMVASIEAFPMAESCLAAPCPVRVNTRRQTTGQ
jgi:hypothetical protein